MNKKSKFGKPFFIIGSGMLVFVLLSVLFLIFILSSVIEVPEVIVSLTLSSLIFIIVGPILFLIGYIKWPHKDRTYNENMILKIIGWSVFFIIMGTIIFFIAKYTIECTQVKDEYETSPEAAREKYGFDTFERWLEEGATGNYLENCMPDIDLSYTQPIP